MRLCTLVLAAFISLTLAVVSPQVLRLVSEPVLRVLWPVLSYGPLVALALYCLDTRITTGRFLGIAARHPGRGEPAAEPLSPIAQQQEESRRNVA
ncbi:MAG: hypothetical protein KAS72_06580 [Phycisphaerales bacterium]|nr:hypothetical protein [Phycisphaerales bacterium]